MSKKKPAPQPVPAAPPADWSPLRLAIITVAVVGGGIAAVTLYFTRSSGGPPGPAPEGMVWVPGGKFHMGTDDTHHLFSDAHPVHEVEIDGFWMDATEVTNTQFARFVEETKYVTEAEKAPREEALNALRPPDAPPVDPKDLVPGALVFVPPSGPVPTNDPSGWWKWTPGACWKHPEGPGSDLKGRENHPVVHVCWTDADAYCKWAGKRLPTEAEWERAARGGLDRKKFVWGDEAPNAGGKWRCNIFQGEFPWKNTADDGHPRTAPVRSFEPNAYGLYDVAGNVWEWCSDWYRPDYYDESPAKNPKGPAGSFDPNEPNPYMPKKCQRGGSFLCSDGFCSRYKPYGRGKGDVDTGLSHVGFRCAKDAK